MLISIAWRNIWRNKLRSAVLMLAIAFGLAGTIFIIGMSQGFIDSRNKKVIETELSNIQIHNPHFSETMRLSDSINRLAEAEKVLRNTPYITAYSERLKTTAMASSSYGSSGIVVVGINPDEEKNVTKVYNYLADSNSVYLDTRRENAILIGRALAKRLQMVSYTITGQTLKELKEKDYPADVIERLEPIKGEYFHTAIAFYDTLENLLTENQFNTYADLIADNCVTYKLGRKIILRMQDVNGQVVEEAFRIAGVFNTENDIFDGTYVFVKKDYLSRLLGVSPQTTNEIAMLVDNKDKVKQYASELQQRLPWLKVQSMYDLDPILKMSDTMAMLYYLIFEIFILFALSFGIINTMLMAVLERTKELGMLMAIGMNRRRVFWMIIDETVMITFTGGVIGMFLGYLLVLYTSHTGLDFSKFVQQGLQSIGYSSVIYPTIPTSVLIFTTLLIIAVGIIAAIYPAMKALRLKPAEALRSDV